METSNNRITYVFADGTKVGQPIGEKALLTEKGKAKTNEQMNEMFDTTAHDKGALGHYTTGNLSVVKGPKENPSSKAEIKAAKRDHKEMQKLNPEGFSKERHHFQAIAVDSKKKSIRKNTIGRESVLKLAS